MNKKHPYSSLLTLGVVSLSALLLAGCTFRSDEDDQPVRTMEEFDAIVQAYYDSRPEFFVFKTPDDIPADLEWENGDGKRVFASPDAQQGGTLRSFIPSMPPTLRPIGPDSNNSFRGEMYDSNGMGLIDMHPDDFTPIPSLAREWAVSEDMQTVYYRLDPDARFSDGEPVTADDFLFTFYFMHSSYIQAPWYNDYYNVEFESITKFDDHTIAITLAEPKPDPVYSSAIGPRPKHFYVDLGDDYPTRYQWRFEPTTGPYELRPENIQRGRRITLTKVEDWWAQDKTYLRGRYNVDRKEYQIIREVDKAFEMFLRGELDMFGLSLPKFWYDRENEEAFQRGYIRRVTFYNQYPRVPRGLYINTARPLLSDPNVRYGLHHATNFQHVIDFYFRGDFARLNTMSDGYGDYSRTDIKAREFNPEKAREYFAEAGFTRTGPDGILMNAQGQRLSFTITMGDNPTKEILPILREEARKAGVEYNIEVLDPTASYQKVMQKNHDITFWGWGVGLPTPRFWEFFHSDNAGKPQTNNITNTSVPEMDPLIDRYRRSTNREEKMELAHQLIEMVHEEASFIPGFYQPWIRAGHWRWVHFPEGFLPPLSSSPDDFGLFWIDEDEQRELMRIRRSRENYADPEPVIYDQYKEP